MYIAHHSTDTCIPVTCIQIQVCVPCPQRWSSRFRQLLGCVCVPTCVCANTYESNEKTKRLYTVPTHVYTYMCTVPTHVYTYMYVYLVQEGGVANFGRFWGWRCPHRTQRLASYVWAHYLRHITRMNKSCHTIIESRHTYERESAASCVLCMSPLSESYHTTNETCHTIIESRHTMIESRHTIMEPRHAYERESAASCVLCMRTLSESCQVYEWIMTHTNASRDAYEER